MTYKEELKVMSNEELLSDLRFNTEYKLYKKRKDVETELLARNPMSEYLTNEELKTIAEWDCFKNGFMPLVEYIKTIWWCPESQMKLTGKKLELHTGGWSGNEEIIQALKQNFVFWAACWYKHVTGGHYYFKIKQK